MRVISAKRLMVASFALMIGLAGCASGSGGSGSGGGGGSFNRLTAADLVNDPALDLFELIRLRRGRWLTARRGGVRGAPRVHVDGTESPGGVEDLRNILVGDVQEVEYLTATDAVTRFGSDYANGAIVVTRRRR